MSERKAEIAVVVVLIVLGVSLIGGGAYLMDNHEHEYRYEYTVKAEQVNEDEMPDEHIAYENLSDAEKEMLYRAFKRSDHFMGGAEAYIVTDEPIENVSNEWRVVEIKGVPMLVAISGPEKEHMFTRMHFVGTVLVVAGFFCGLLAMFGIEEIRNPTTHRY